MTREFIIQRYASVSWPMLRGERPFIATGPMFKTWVVPGSLSRIGKWLIRPEILEAIRSIFPAGRVHHDDLTALADMLLIDGVVQALWATSGPGYAATATSRRRIALTEVVAETMGRPKGEHADPFDMATEMAWGLATLPGPEVHRSYTSEDGIALEPMRVPIITGT